jgi:orotidine-5'-phosphate decarboxylase
VNARDRLIVALDVPSAIEAQEIVYELGEAISTYKVGLQLFTAEGPRFVSELVNSGRKVFLDLKFHDIPNTVAGAVRSAAELGVSMLTVHAAGGSRMLQAAVDAAKAGSHQPTILAVTILTSLSQAELEECGLTGAIDDLVKRLAKLSKSSGCGGVVSSAQEASTIRELVGPDMAIVTPGIRRAGAAVGDQSRIATPMSAIRAGASHLVVGRPVLEAENRNRAATAIIEEIAAALASPEMKTAGSQPA